MGFLLKKKRRQKQSKAMQSVSLAACRRSAFQFGKGSFGSLGRSARNGIHSEVEQTAKL